MISGAQCNYAPPPTDLLSIVNPLVWSLLQQNPIGNHSNMYTTETRVLMLSFFIHSFRLFL